MSEWQVATYEYRGIPKSLPDRVSAENAAKDGKLGEDSRVTVTMLSGERKFGLARDFNQFASVFAMIDEVEPGAISDPDPTPDTADAMSRPTGPTEPTEIVIAPVRTIIANTAESDGKPVDQSWNHHEPSPTPRAFNPKWAVGAAIGVLAVLILIALWPGSSKTVYVVADSPTYSSPSLSTATDSKLVHGENLTVEDADVGGWLIIMDGDHAGQLVPAGIVSDAKPTQLDRSNAGARTASVTQLQYSNPDMNAQVVGQMAGGEQYIALGTIVDASARLWTVVMGEKDGLPAVSYVRYAKPQPTIAAQPTAEPEPKETPSPTPTQDKCADISAVVARLHCEVPELTRLERNLTLTHAESCRKRKAVGMPCPPISQFLKPVQECRTASCARRAYSTQTADARAIGRVEVKAAPPPPQPVRDQTRLAEPSNNPGRWIRPNDYPSRAMRAEEEGTVRFQLTIDTSGRVSSCAIAQSSGSTHLDEATCKFVGRRARFSPALDRAGTPVQGYYSNTVRWVLPQ